MTEPTVHVLLVECPDQPGLVHGITGTLLRHGCNVTANQEFVDADAKNFFMRTEFTGEIDRDALEQSVNAILPNGRGARLATRGRPRVVVFASREHHCLADLLVRHRFGELNAEIVAVISNHDVLRSFTDDFRIPFYQVSHEGRTREEQEVEILALVQSLRPDWLVLAKYMRVLTSHFVSTFPNRIINIHHSFLPAFVGAKPYLQAWQRGVKVIGATAHFVTEALDQGPIIAQQVISVDHTHGPSDMSRAGREIEQAVLSRALTLILEARVFLSGNRTIIFD